jgi:hypothetical protein
MGKWIWIVPLVLLLGACSKSRPQSPGAAIGYNATAPSGNPEPVAPPPAPQQTNSPAAALAPAASDSLPPQAGLPVGSSSANEPPRAVAANTPSQPQAPGPNRLIPRGARLRVRIDQEIDTRHNHAGDRFSATLYEPVTANGVPVLPVGTRFRGHLTASSPSHRLRGRAVLGLTLDAFQFQGREYRIDTSRDHRESRSHKKHNLGFIAGGGGFGAAVGAIAGGGAGAAIDAVAGGGAGLAGAVITGKKQVAVRAEAPLVFTLRERVAI